jgi:hypothetical protein
VKNMLNRRDWIVAALSMLFARSASGASVRKDTVKVRKNPGCGCCDKWAEHLEAAGFLVDIVEDPNLDAYRDRLGVPAQLRSCHTGVVGGYVAEGHVPGDLIRKMLNEKPPIVGIAVAGMPQGSPGMETGRTQKYDVTAFKKDGTSFVYASR